MKDDKEENIFDKRKVLSDKKSNDGEKLYDVNIEKYNKQLESEKKLSKIRKICLIIFLIPWLSFLIPATLGVLKEGNKYNVIFLVPFWIFALVAALVVFIKK